jgi:hypothetical protein
VLESGVARRLLRDLDGCGSVRQQVIAPVVLLGLAGRVVRAEGGHWFPCKAFEDEGRVGLGVPCPSFPG